MRRSSPLIKRSPIVSKMILKCITLFFCGCFIKVYAEYEFPEAKILVYENQGFSVSIPDEEGLELFAFHGQVNKNLRDLEAGHFSKDILRKRNGFWVYENKNARLKKGDVLYFWLYVIKDKIGYRDHLKEYRVSEFAPKPGRNRPGPLPPNPGTCEEGSSFRYENILLNMTEILIQNQNELKKLQDDIAILKEILETYPKASKQLTFTGILPRGKDAEELANLIVEEKLGLQIPLESVSWNPDGSLSFQVPNLEAKLKLLKAAKIKLLGSNIQLKL